MGQYTYEAALAASERINWRVEDIIGGDKRLDFSRPFLPESLARVEHFRFLGERAKLALNQIRGLGYLHMFGLVEEFILPFVVDHARPQLGGDSHLVRAYLEFAAEEAKHIHLFRRFREEFERGFGTRCGLIGPAEAVGRAVLAHRPLAVALAILQIEWMTQRHWLEAVKDDRGLDPLFKSLLKHHWMEEAQHAKLDTLMVGALSEAASAPDIDAAIDEYLEIGGLFDGALGQQAELDAASLERVTGRTLDADQREVLVAAQHQAQRWTFLGSGMMHENFLATVAGLRPGARDRIVQVAAALG